VFYILLEEIKHDVDSLEYRSNALLFLYFVNIEMSKEAEERAYKKNREDRCIEMTKVNQAIEIKRAESAYKEDLASGTSKAIAAKRRTQRLKKTQKMLSKKSIAKCLHVLPDISSKYGYFYTIEQYKTFAEHQYDPITMVDNSAVCKEILNIKLAAYKEFQKILSKTPIPKKLYNKPPVNAHSDYKSCIADKTRKPRELQLYGTAANFKSIMASKNKILEDLIKAELKKPNPDFSELERRLSPSHHH